MTPKTDRLVSDDDLRTFHEDGAVLIRGVIGRDWLDRLAAAFEEAVASPGTYAKSYGPADARYYTDHHLCTRFATFRDFLRLGPTTRVAAEILGAAQLHVYDEHLLIKEPGAPAPTYWHHDMPYFSIDGNDIASVWFSLDPVTEDTGALRFAVGSHRWDKLFQPVKIGLNEPNEMFDRDELVDRVPDIDGNPEAYPTVLMEVEPGDVIVFHGRTLHASGGNSRTDRSRRALSIRYAGDDIRWKNRSDSPLLFDRALNDGDPLDLIEDQCPRVWPPA